MLGYDAAERKLVVNEGRLNRSARSSSATPSSALRDVGRAQAVPMCQRSLRIRVQRPDPQASDGRGDRDIAGGGRFGPPPFPCTTSNVFMVMPPWNCSCANAATCPAPELMMQKIT